MLRICLTILICLAGPLSLGCRTSLKSFAKGTTGQLEAPSVAGRAPAPPPADAAPLVEPTREQAFAAVLDDLQAIGKDNPAAQQQLLTQLAESDPAHWEGLVTRARSTMLYQRQLAGEPAKGDVMQASGQQTARVDVASNPTTRGAGRNAPDASAPPLPSRPETWPTQTYETQQPEPAGQGVDVRRFDPALTQTAAFDTIFSRSVNPAQTVPFAAPARSVPYAPTHQQQAGAAPPAPVQPTTQNWNDSLQAAIKQLSEELDHRPQSVNEAYDHVRLRMLQLAAGNLDGAAASVPGLTATEQQYWSHQLLTVSTMLDNETQPEVRRRAAAGGLHLQNAVTALEQLGSLTVGHLRFCEEVYGFGAYQPLKHARFRPGDEVKIYAEVANFKTVTTPQGEHTSLATSYQVLDQHGSRVDGGDVPVVNDYCASRRRDFHIQYGITLPKGIYPGRYVLELTLTDQLGDKIGHGTIDFEIVATK
ncbi:hypothetical protein KOR34_46690 [Posidoniimonas corsicana]|uniref:Uncharacterized protein n=1 Tax=Posidoniimonas corsicana TaxID=1938618 RepID=A0A5C5V043_9BACT|nr:hypothetical protein [Posidoniimonas corsicana]TWT31293.1 hypothetical protein KOR34_46690 [Posidoniimonas corsicana]